MSQEVVLKAYFSVVDLSQKILNNICIKKLVEKPDNTSVVQETY